jgi:hypothetical protein
LEPKAELYYFVGYGQLDGTKGWKMLDVHTGKTVTTCDVRFLKEPKFPSYPLVISEDSEDLFTVENDHDLSGAYDPAQGFDDSVSDHDDVAQDDAEAPVATRLRPRANRATSIDSLPQNYKEAATIPVWSNSMNKELNSLTKHKVWTVVDKLLPGRKAVSSRWLYRIKYNPDGSIAKYKSRLVARGFTQEAGVDYQDIFAPVARHTSLRIFLSLVASDDLECDQADVETAFLNAPLEEIIHMRLPDGTLVQLRKCIYGLKQSPHNWNKLLGQNWIFAH